MITGLVPVKKQAGEFDQVFKDTIPIGDGGAGKEWEKTRDIPVYTRRLIERAEITGEPNESLHWEPLSTKGLNNMIATEWGLKVADLVGRDYTDVVYTMPLGPLVGAEWDESVGHEPEIPMAAKEEREKLIQQAKDAEPAVADDDAETSEATQPKSPSKKQVAKKNVEYRLFRFFDLTAKPGKRYRYRVQLWLRNPNYKLADKFLKDPESKKDELRPSPWSEPSEVVEIPTGNEMILVAVNPTRGKDVATKIKLVANDPESGLPAVIEDDFYRGTVVNVTKTCFIAKPGEPHPESRSVTFETNAVLLDARGGAPFGRDKSFTEPGNILLLDADGKLVAHNELDDLELSENNPLMTEEGVAPIINEGGKAPPKTPKASAGKRRANPNDLLNGSPAPTAPRGRRSRSR